MPSDIDRNEAIGIHREITKQRKDGETESAMPYPNGAKIDVRRVEL